MNTALSQTQLIISDIKKFVSQQLQDDFTGHDMAHIDRVVKLALLISESEPIADKFIITMSAYLHDLIDEKLVTNIEKAKQTIDNMLDSQNVTCEQKKAIFSIICNMSYRKNLISRRILSLEGQIVQDADRLDAIGAIGIARTFYYGGNKHHIMHQSECTPRTELNEKQYSHPSTIINHFHEKLLRLKDQMNTQAAKKIAQERHDFLLTFLAQFEKEWCIDSI